MQNIKIEKLIAFIVEKMTNEISADLSYHNLSHTLGVLEQCNNYINRLNINENEACLLQTAAVLHDIGFLWVYDNHEDRGVTFAKEELPKWGYSDSDLKIISGIIMATKIPQNPTTLLEEIICDADLNYLGTDSFEEIGETLRQEFLTYNKLKIEDNWNAFQIKFLEGHRFRTTYAKEHREPIKQKHLTNLIQTQTK